MCCVLHMLTSSLTHCFSNGVYYCLEAFQVSKHACALACTLVKQWLLFITHQTVWVQMSAGSVHIAPQACSTVSSWSPVVCTCAYSTTHATQCIKSVCMVNHGDCSIGAGITTPALVCCNKRSTALAAAAPCIAGAILPGQPRCRYAKYALHTHANMSAAALLR